MKFRRPKADFIEKYIITKTKDRVSAHSFLPRVGESRTTGLRFKLRRQQFNKNMRGNLFTENVTFMDRAGT